MRDAGLDWRPTFHDLRHAMVTWSLEGGASARAVQGDAGHASLRTTEIYVHRLDSRVSDERLAAMAKMYARMRGEPAPDDGTPASAGTGAADPLRQAALALLETLPPERLAELIAEGLRGQNAAASVTALPAAGDRS